MCHCHTWQCMECWISLQILFANSLAKWMYVGVFPASMFSMMLRKIPSLLCLMSRYGGEELLLLPTFDMTLWSTSKGWSGVSYNLRVDIILVVVVLCGSGSTRSKEAKHYSSSIYHMCHRKSSIPHQSLFVTHHFLFRDWFMHILLIRSVEGFPRQQQKPQIPCVTT
jgi:hypothetical protein